MSDEIPVVKKQLGKIVRISRDLEIYLNQRRRKKESVDASLRRHFGLPTVKGKAQDLKLYYILDNNGQPMVFRDKSDARGAAIQLAISQGRKKTEGVVIVREVP